jgi:hypothetical protein
MPIQVLLLLSSSCTTGNSQGTLEPRCVFAGTDGFLLAILVLGKTLERRGDSSIQATQLTTH